MADTYRVTLHSLNHMDAELITLAETTDKLDVISAVIAGMNDMSFVCGDYISVSLVDVDHEYGIPEGDPISGTYMPEGERIVGKYMREV